MLVSALLSAQSIIVTEHNLSVTGNGKVKSTNESEICLFCHTPHTSNPIGPLWNKRTPGQSYILYNSSTMKAMPGQPDGSSILCLSCHDGTIALGNVLSRKENLSFENGVSYIPAGKSNLSTDLSNDHPVSFLYNAALSSMDNELKDPAAITTPVKLEGSKVQCVSCHDPHKNMYSQFLTNTNQYSALCVSCHQKDDWTNSSHRNSNAVWNGMGSNPWFHTSYSSVAENACENCHNPHTAGGKERLLKYQAEEANCFDCHNGNVASSTKNIQVQFTKAYKHNVSGYTLVHDANENAMVTNKHVECADCHNPHATKNQSATAPNVSGYNQGTIGISAAGSAVKSVQYQYEICFRCHSTSPATPSSTSRVIEQNDTRLEFATSNPSFHPVIGARNNSEVSTSLISPYSVTSAIYCTDCHASDGAGSPAGPHGSIYPQIMKYQYLKADGATSANGTFESPSAYALCYSCHNRSNILSDMSSFPEHKKHIVDQKTPCNTCHDPHGISSSQGNATNNSNLINFRSDVVTAANGNLRFEDIGVGHGRCYLTCHGVVHNPLAY